jgi:hypothetical protein
MLLIVKVFGTLATQYHLEYDSKAVFETLVFECNESAV